MTQVFNSKRTDVSQAVPKYVTHDKQISILFAGITSDYYCGEARHVMLQVKVRRLCNS